MSWILTAMIAFGVAVGLAFPAVVSSIVDVHPGDEGTFRIACILAGFFVAGFAYGVARFTLYRANRRLAQLAAFDSLTGLLNRREFVRTLDVELARALREEQALSLIIIDLDHFKAVNDAYGHGVGDEVLAIVAAELASSVRSFDAACRIGGEEFAVILPRTDRSEACIVAGRVRRCIARTGQNGLPTVTVSCGIATHPRDADTARALARCADDAMYEAKEAGRNATRAWSGLASTT